MTTKRLLYILTAVVLTLSLASCRTGGIAGKNILKAKQNEELRPLVEPQERLTDLTAKTSITIDYNQHPINLKGRLRMRRDEVVQLTFTALGVVEIAMIEFTPKEAYIIDRVNKRYVKFDYSSGFVNSIGGNFTTIQSLFWNRMFIPGKEKAWERLGDFDVEKQDTRNIIKPTSQGMLKSLFYTDSNFGQLQQTRLTLQDYELVWQYDMFSSLDIYSFPTVSDISIYAGSQALGLHIALSNISYVDKDWTAGTNLSRYTEVTMEEMLSILNVLK